jgi:DNA-binding transcriptional regulator YiaG
VHLAQDGEDNEYCFITQEEEYVDKEWIVDSGAESSICMESNVSSAYRKTMNQVNRGVGGTIQVVGRGDIQVLFPSPDGSTRITLKDVAHVPSFHSNLLSIWALDHTGGSASFSNGKVTLKLTNSKILGHGEAQKNTNQGLHHIQLKAIKQKEEVASKAYAAIYQKTHTHTWEQWHRVLGHANQKTLKMMAREDPQGIPVIAESNKVYQCEACIKSKQHTAPLNQKLETIYMSISELVISDVWGPAQVHSLQGNSYFVTLINVYSHFSAVYFMKSNKEVQDRYKDFEALVKTQTGNKIKQLRTAEGKEYVNAEFKSYITSKGTIHKLTAA